MLYCSLEDEVRTESMIDKALQDGKAVYVPVIVDKENKIIQACRVTKDTRYQKGVFGIREPVDKQFIEPRKLDLVIVPVRAVDFRGNRLGRGAGYYDRFLKRLSSKTVIIGLAFSCQMFESLPVTSHDVGLDMVITEAQKLLFNRKNRDSYHFPGANAATGAGARATGITEISRETAILRAIDRARQLETERLITTADALGVYEAEIGRNTRIQPRYQELRTTGTEDYSYNL